VLLSPEDPEAVFIITKLVTAVTWTKDCVPDDWTVAARLGHYFERDAFVSSLADPACTVSYYHSLYGSPTQRESSLACAETGGRCSTRTSLVVWLKWASARRGGSGATNSALRGGLWAALAATGTCVYRDAQRGLSGALELHLRSSLGGAPSGDGLNSTSGDGLNLHSH